MWLDSLLPAWTFGLWLSTSFLTSYDGETVAGFLQGMQDRNCPVRVFHLDCFWMKQYEWSVFANSQRKVLIVHEPFCLGARSLLIPTTSRTQRRTLQRSKESTE